MCGDKIMTHDERETRINLHYSTEKENFLSNEKANTGIGMIVTYFILAILVAAFIPSTIDTLIGVNTSGWGATEITIFGTFTIFIMTGVMYMIIPKDLIKGKF
jgi:uncharacterized membrane protein (DUF485 family)